MRILILQPVFVCIHLRVPVGQQTLTTGPDACLSASVSTTGSGRALEQSSHSTTQLLHIAQTNPL